jgi:hypothetical protein
MNLKQYGSKSAACLTVNGNKVFYSYKTPVAVLLNGEFFVTTEKFSSTTSKHVNLFIREVGISPNRISQGDLRRKSCEVITGPVYLPY